MALCHCISYSLAEYPLVGDGRSNGLTHLHMFMCKIVLFPTHVSG